MVGAANNRINYTLQQNLSSNRAMANYTRWSREQSRTQQDRWQKQILESERMQRHFPLITPSSSPHYYRRHDESALDTILDIIGGLGALYGTGLTVSNLFVMAVLYVGEKLTPSPPSFRENLYEPSGILFRCAMVCYLVAIASQVKKINVLKLIKPLRQKVSEIFQKHAKTPKTIPK